MTLRKRDEIPEQYRWNAESVFCDWCAWEDAFSKLDNDLPGIAALKGTLGESPEALGKAMAAVEDFARRLGVIFFYASMSHSTDARNPEIGERFSRAQGLNARGMSALSFLEPELLQMDEEKLHEWINENPDLAVLRHYVDDLLRKKAHIRSEEVEQILGMAVEPFSAAYVTYGMLTDADMEFSPAVDSNGGEHDVSQGTFRRLLSDQDRSLRRTAWDSYLGQYCAHNRTLASNLALSIKQCVFTSRVRRYPDSLTAVLSRDNIPVEVFQNLIEAFKRHLPLWHRYWRVRRKMLGVEELHPYDIWAPLTETQPDIPYEQAVDWITEGLAPMGEEYVQTVRRGALEDRWVDVYPSEGKRAGAFSYGSHGTYPFICMSYNNTILSLSTLAHELGHSMHSYLTWNNQPVLYGDYSLFVAEVASNFHQALVRANLLKKDDPALRIAVLQEAMSNFHRYFFIMPTLARFELEMHQRVEAGEGLSAESMMKRTVELFEEGYGGEMSYDPEQLGMFWATFGHLYEDYYVYQYATGISGAHALAARVLEGGQGAVDDYLKFLKTGSSLYPLDALKVGGVDLTSPEPVEAAFRVLDGIIGELEEAAG